MSPKAILKHTNRQNTPVVLYITILVLSLSVEIAAAEDDRYVNKKVQLFSAKSYVKILVIE